MSILHTMCKNTHEHVFAFNANRKLFFSKGGLIDLTPVIINTHICSSAEMKQAVDYTSINLLIVVLSVDYDK